MPFFSNLGTGGGPRQILVGAAGKRFITATGGNSVWQNGVYKYHLFTSTGNSTFTVTSTSNVPGGNNVEYLIVGGGGAGGGGDVGAGGGGGGYRTNASGFRSGGPSGSQDPTMTVSATSYTVQVGSGGTGVASSGSQGGNGGQSSFNGITALGGGGGAGWGSNAGSGNGTVATGGGESGGGNPAGTPTQGYPGGGGQGAPNYPQGGGGGAGNGNTRADRYDSNQAGCGGKGKINPFGTDCNANGTPIGAPAGSQDGNSYAGPTGGAWFLGGGGGGGQEGGGRWGDGGLGGGGRGGRQGPDTGCSPGGTNTGGGGGGEDPQAGCPGGPGVVIIRYPIVAITAPTLGSSAANPASSGVALWDAGIRGSGLYYISTSNGGVKQVYVDLSGDSCDAETGKAGWMLVGSWSNSLTWTQSAATSNSVFSTSPLNCFSSAHGDTNINWMRVKVGGITTDPAETFADFYFYSSSTTTWKRWWTTDGTSVYTSSASNAGSSVNREAIRSFSWSYNMKTGYRSTSQVWNNLSDGGGRQGNWDTGLTSAGTSIGYNGASDGTLAVVTMNSGDTTAAHDCNRQNAKFGIDDGSNCYYAGDRPYDGDSTQTSQTSGANSSLWMWIK